MKELQVHFEVNLWNRAEQGFQKFRKETVRNTKNRSIIKLFKYKFTIKPVISCELDSHKFSNIAKKVRALNSDLRCPIARRLDKTKIVL